MTSDVVPSTSIPGVLSKEFGNASPKKLSWRNYLEIGMLRCMTPDNDTIDRDTARRLIALRFYAGCGDSQTRFAQKYGFTVKQWNNFERGSPLSKEAAIQLVRKFPGLTLDWLHLGKPDGLPGTLRAELEAAGNALTSAEATRRGR
jgi:hypothetical protein